MRPTFFMIALIVALQTSVAAPPSMSDPQSLAADADDQVLPAVAYNTVHDEFFVVWQAYPPAGTPSNISGVRVDSAGSPLGPSFVISDVSTLQYEPDVAYDPVADRYLVVWSSDNNGPDYDIVGRFVPWDGPSLAYPVFEIQTTTPDQRSPSVVLNRTAGEFLVVWDGDDTSGPGRVAARRWSADGSGPASPVFGFTVGTDIRCCPAVSWNPSTSEYLVVYERVTSGSNYDVWGTRLSATGTVLGAEFAVADALDNEGSAAIAACRGEYIAAWTALPGPDTQIHTRAIAGDGTVGAVIGHPSQGYDFSQFPSVACNPAGAENLVSWQSLSPNGNFGIIGSFVGLDGDAAENFEIAVDPGDVLVSGNSEVAFGDRQRALVVWSGERPDQTSFDISGRLVGGRLFADGFESGDTSHWSHP